MEEVAYTSKIRIVRQRGPLREAYLPPGDHRVTFGVHSEIAEHYGTDLETYGQDTTTLDYVVAATGG